MAQSWVHFIVACLMLGTVAVATGVPADRCDNGVAVSRAFQECLMAHVMGNATVMTLVLLGSTPGEIKAYLPTFCGTDMTAIRQCFTNSIANCDGSQQQQLQALSLQAGIYCQNGDVHPAVNAVLNTLSQADLAASQHCPGEESSNDWGDCQNHAKTTSLGSMGRDAYMALSVAEFTPVATAYHKELMACTARVTKGSSDNCRQWRGVSFKRMCLMQQWANLGVSLPFTQQELTALFQ